MGPGYQEARRYAAALVLATCGIGAPSCASPRQATQVIVSVVMEPGVESETSSLMVRVSGAAVGAELTEVSSVPYHASDLDGIPDPVVLAIAPAGGDTSRLFEAEAEALDAAGRTVATARVRGAFQPGRTLELRLVLEDRCRGVSCPIAETCRTGRCVPAIVEPGMDGGVGDAGTGDGGIPIGGECRRDAQCSDGVVCNGLEACVESRCAAGERPSCDDGIACTDDKCISSGCVNLPDAGTCTAGPDGVCDPVRGGCQYSTCDATTCVPSGCETAECRGTTCQRSSLCGTGETCCAGRCARAGCSDDNPCTTDVCHPTAGCTNEATIDPRACSDSNACTTTDTCSAGVCRGAGTLPCDDGNACTTERCDPIAGCVSQPVSSGASCANTNPCDGTETCISGVCAMGTPLGCDDGIACTIDSCAAPSGCTNVPQNGLCTALPGGTCVAGSGCQYSSCSAATCVAGPCQTATCMGSMCVVTPVCGGAASACCAGSCVTPGCNDNNPCTADSCGGSGCVNVPMAGAPCDDGSACTIGDTCAATGVCTPGPGCSDGNPCTNDVCAGGGCTFPANTAACNDGDDCTIADACAGGACRPGTALSCEDFNECTADSCTGGACLNEPLTGTSCGDLDICFIYRCDSGLCMGIPQPGCCPTC